MSGLYFPAAESVTLVGIPTGSQYPTFQPPNISDDELPILLGPLTAASITVPAFSLTGESILTWYDDWYNRIHLMPRVIDLLNVVSDQTRNIVLWNAYLENKNLTSTDFPALEGISVASPVVTPYTIKPLQTLTYTLSVSTDGPPTIDAILNWNITGETGLQIEVTGRRIIIWPFPPDWSESFTESLEYLTDVMTSFSGDEQRYALRSKPRRILEYTSLVKKEDAAIAGNLLWGWQNRNYAVPLWFDKSVLTTAASSGGISLSADTTNRGFFNGGLVLLINGSVDYEAVEVSSFTSSTITLAKPLERGWLSGTSVYPVNIARMPMNVGSSQLTDSVKRLPVSFVADPVQNDPYIPIVAPTTTHNGYEVILRRPNWAVPIDIDNEFLYETADYQTGGIAYATSTTFPKVTRRFQWDLYSKTEIRLFRELFGRLKGRNRAVYLPTWFSEFELWSTEVASSVTIKVKNNEFYRMVNVDPALNTLMILPISGAPIIRTIGSVGIDPTGFVTLGLNAAIGIDLNSTTLKRLSLVHLCRLSADRVTINRLSDSKATVEANFTLVKA